MTKQANPLPSFAALGARAGQLMRGETDTSLEPVFLPADMVRDIRRMSGSKVEQFIGRAVQYVAEEVANAR